MRDSSPSLITGPMLGLFLAFGVDLVVIVAALWYVGRVTTTTAAGTAVAVFVTFALWIAVRWVRLRRDGGDVDDDRTGRADATAQPDPVDRLKRRYADGEVSDEEFERRIERLIDADSRLEEERPEEPERAFESK